MQRVYTLLLANTLNYDAGSVYARMLTVLFVNVIDVSPTPLGSCDTNTIVY